MLYSTVAADDVILRADGFCRTEESAVSLQDKNPKKQQIPRCAQNDTIISLYSNDENGLDKRGWEAGTKPKDRHLSGDRRLGPLEAVPGSFYARMEGYTSKTHS